MTKFLLLILFFISSIGVSQDFPDGMVVVEFNASFKRALPILQKYVPKENLQQCKSVLKAAALTYVAGSIISIFKMRRIIIIIIPFIRMLLLRR